MAALPWYKWEPGAIPYLDRISYEARGILWSWADDHWRGMQVPSPLFEASETATREANKVWPTLRQWLDEKRITAEENSKSKHINAVNANRIRWESKRNPNGIQDIDIELEKDKEQREKQPPAPTALPPRAYRRRNGGNGKLKDPMEGMDLVEVVWKLHPDRKNQDGKTISIGARLPTRDRLLAKVKAYGLTAADVEAIQTAYLEHPNVAQGYVQATEVFWGDNGRWFDCWQLVQERRRNAKERSVDVFAPASQD